MAWPTFTVDVTQNSNQIKIHGPVPASEIPAGFEVIIGNVSNLEVSYGTAIMYDGSNTPYSHLYLVRPYTGVTATNLEMVVKPTGSQFNDVVSIFQNASNLLNSTMEGYRQFVEGTSPVSFQPLDENAEPISIKPLLQMNQEAQTAVSEAISAFQNAAGTAAGYDVTSSATDVANGANGKKKLLRVGDFGIGSSTFTSIESDLNTLVHGGFYQTGSATTNKPGSDTYGIQVSHSNASGSRVHQLAFAQTSGKVFSRFFNGTSWSSWREILHTGLNTLAPTTGALTVGTNDASNLVLKTNNTSRVTVDSIGNVGIGSISPESRLQVNLNYDGEQALRISHNSRAGGTGQFFTLSGVNNENLLQVYDTGSTLTNVSISGNTLHSWSTSGTERMRITSTGNALIGTTTDNGVDKLQVNGSICTNRKCEKYFSGALSEANVWEPVYTFPLDNTLGCLVGSYFDRRGTYTATISIGTADRNTFFGKVVIENGELVSSRGVDISNRVRLARNTENNGFQLELLTDWGTYGRDFKILLERTTVLAMPNNL